MNKSGMPTRQKIMIPLRLPMEIYEQMAELVHSEKKEARGYSMNQYLTDLVEKDLKARKKKNKKSIDESFQIV